MLDRLQYPSLKPIHIIGGGLAGSEAAWQIACRGVPVVLHEMRPATMTPAHQTSQLAELVCSNSFRSDDANFNAVGLLHQEMRQFNSLILRCADQNQVPAGGALAVDREGFAQAVTSAIVSHPLITVHYEEIDDLPPQEWDNVIIATGPLTSGKLAEALRTLTGETQLAFFDAIAPIVHKDSIDMDVCWFQSRYDKGSTTVTGEGGVGADYINCPMTRAQYEAFVARLVAADTIPFKEWEGTPYFDGCLPIEVMAARGVETLRHGPMKPVGLTNPHQPDVKAYAIVQLRQDNALGTLYNMVGFQTKMRYVEQVEVFRTIPGLENAEFARLGGLHRKLYLNSPKLLDASLRLKTAPRLRFAGQMTGCEGYVESAAVGLYAGMMAVSERLNISLAPLPQTTALGALIAHITGGHIETIDSGPRSFQPMNVNFGLFPPLIEALPKPEGKRLRGPEKAQLKKHMLTNRARADLAAWMGEVMIGVDTVGY